MYNQCSHGRSGGCCRRNRCQNGSDASSGIYAVVYYRHYVNVPMRVFYGPGFTSEDSLEGIDQSLQTMAEQFSTQKTFSRRNGCCC